MAEVSIAAALGHIPDNEAWHRTIILPKDILDNPPSGEHDVDWESEQSHRIWGCELIQEAGVLLRLPQVVMCTAQNLLQRFFYRKSLTKFDAYSVAMACTLLAMKIEEEIRPMPAVVLVFLRMFERRLGLKPSSLEPVDKYRRILRDEMLRVELHVLKELGFGFYNIMDHPHKFILYYVRVLKLEEDAAQRAWNYLNDSLRTDLSLRFRAEVIACAAIYLASRSLGIKLPDNPPWWVLFNADMKEMGEICNTILSLYNRSRVTFLDPLCERSIFHRGGEMRGDDPVSDDAGTGVIPAAGSEEVIEGTAARNDGVENSRAESSSQQHESSPVERANAITTPPPASDAKNESEAGTQDPSEAAAERIDNVTETTLEFHGSRSESRSRSQSRSRSKGQRSRSSSRSGDPKDDNGPDHRDIDEAKESIWRPDRAQDRDRDKERKRIRGQRHSRSRSRDQDHRHEDSMRDRTADHDRGRDRDRSRGREYIRERRYDNRERDRLRDNRHRSRR